MRPAVVLLLSALPAQAWEFSPNPICTLSHETPSVAVQVTYDPAIPEYAIRLSLAEGLFPDAPLFAIRFDGAYGLTISTNRHFSPNGDGRAIEVRDSGFGNVLDGLEFNDTATALIGDLAVPVPLDGAADPVRAFRACTEGASV